MQLKNLIEIGDDRAVSPVIGVILMVAITVILAAVIGAFVIGIGDEQAAQPTASIDFDQGSDSVTVSHQSGDTLDTNEISFGGDIDVSESAFGSDWHTASHAESGDDEPNSGADLARLLWSSDGETISAGQSIELGSTHEDDGSGNADEINDAEEPPWPVLPTDDTDDFGSASGTINIIWDSSDTDQSSVIASFDYDIDDQ